MLLTTFIMNKNSEIFLSTKASSSKNNNDNIVATDKSNNSNFTFKSKKSKKYNNIDKKITTIEITVLIMKTVTAIRVVMIIQLMAFRHYQTQRKLFS